MSKATKKATLRAIPKQTSKPRFDPLKGEPDEVPILISVLQEIEKLAGSLDSALVLLESSTLDNMHIARDVFQPISEQFQMIFSSEWPDLQAIRDNMEKTGVDIRG
jgi:hypothetical protein